MERGGTCRDLVRRGSHWNLDQWAREQQVVLRDEAAGRTGVGLGGAETTVGFLGKVTNCPWAVSSQVRDWVCLISCVRWPT